MKGKIILFTGGARSGKSLAAEQYAISQGGPLAYIATAQIYDQEMESRVALHRQRRADQWQTFEAPYDAHLAIEQAAQGSKVILFDCLTLYTSNLLLDPNGSQEPEDKYQYMIEQIDKLIMSAQKTKTTVIFVTNEVGMGIVPSNALARQYRDLSGSANQKVAAVADEVYLVVSGLTVELKKIAVNFNREV
ncbi:bifunctional adenosylcobinamide kinase/adenosylcobinamide-phosphate guanylyltransferase [Pelosinus sp. sgz500959]|uniref:bifunctional adenosylcobinamide kinase/adenosylcobinamide-phosphate guanylyltransferase n=1 Tax=Pelosinus sp. sgz500959 TaxID=3242472 RepID=UPI00366B101C